MIRLSSFSPPFVVALIARRRELAGLCFAVLRVGLFLASNQEVLTLATSLIYPPELPRLVILAAERYPFGLFTVLDLNMSSII